MGKVVQFATAKERLAQARYRNLQREKSKRRKAQSRLFLRKCRILLTRFTHWFATTVTGFIAYILRLFYKPVAWFLGGTAFCLLVGIAVYWLIPDNPDFKGITKMLIGLGMVMGIWGIYAAVTCTMAYIFRKAKARIVE